LTDGIAWGFQLQERPVRHKFLAWVLIGLMAGWLSGKIMRGAGFGLVADLCVGLIGGVIGGWIFAQLGIRSYGFVGGLAAATVGAIVLVAMARVLGGGFGK
jgi:uncharacterized membrane protein YeaQ/YmgE (transglycosylase-associated protein family)